MFWDDLSQNSLQQLLSSGRTVQLEEVLADPYLLQEVRIGNKELLEILTSPKNLLQLTKSALCPQIDESLPLEEHYNMSNLCTEVLTVGSVSEIANAFLENSACMEIFTNLLDDIQKMNSVSAIFYNKVFISLMAKNFAAVLAFMKENHFLEKSSKFLKYGAIADLLESFLRINADDQNLQLLQQYLVDEKLIPGLISMLDINQSPTVHENASDTYIEILKNIGEILAVNETKDDILHNEFISESNINDILNRMLKVENDGNKIDNEMRASLLMNGMNMLLALIENNTTGQIPSQLIEAGEPDAGIWTGSGPGDINSPFDKSKVWLPDREKTVERLTAMRTADFVRIAIEDLEGENAGDSWLWALHLIGQLANTNHLPTHNLLVAGFKETNFKRLFEFVPKFPLMHILQHKLRNIISYGLYTVLSDSNTISPLVGYFVNDCNLFSLLRKGVFLTQGIPKMHSVSIRSFYIYLADSFVKAAKYTSNRDLINNFIKSSEDWNNDTDDCVAKGLDVYWKKNKPDECKDMSPQNSARTHNAEEFPTDIESFNRFECTAVIPDFAPVSGPTSVLHHFAFKAALNQEAMEVDLNENEAKEEAFEQAPEFLPMSKVFPESENKTSDESWPGETNENANNSDDVWGEGLAARLSNGSTSSNEEWPGLSNNSFGKMNGHDNFADFKDAVKTLDNTLKNEDKDFTNFWNQDWKADFEQTSTSNANESEA